MSCSVIMVTESHFIFENYSQLRAPVRRSHVNITRVFGRDEPFAFKRTKPLKAQRRLQNNKSKFYDIAYVYKHSHFSVYRTKINNSLK